MTTNIAFAGDYNAESIILIGTAGIKDTTLDISSMIVELNIYESIDQQALTGTVVVTDAIDLVAKIPLTGNERISFKMSTPSGIIDASMETGHPFHIYKLSHKRQLNEGVQSYILHFCSREMLRSVRTRVSKADQGQLDEIASRIFTDREGLDSRKTLFVEPTRNADKYTFPNIRPLDALAMLSTKALSGSGTGAGYYFYETTQGFYFRSYENMVAIRGKLPRPVVESYDYKVRNTNIGENEDNARPRGKDVFADLRSVDSYEFINNYDSVFHQSTGTYASHIIMHDFYNKSYQEIDFDYHAHYEDQMHTDTFTDENQMLNSRFPITPAPVDFDQKSVGEYEKSRISLIGTAPFTHGEDTGIFGVQPDSEGLLEAKRISQRNSVANGTILRLTVPGQCNLQAGDIINFDLRSMQKQDIIPGDDTRDPLFAGRYLIRTLRHRFHDGAYKCVLECSKDSYFSELPVDDVSFPPEKAGHRSSSGSSNTEGTIVSIDSEDRASIQDSYRGRF